MQTESPEKLTGIKGHRLVHSALPVVFVREFYPPRDGFNLMVGDGDAVRVSFKVFNHLLWPCEGLLGIHYPIALVQSVDEVLGERNVFPDTKGIEHFHKLPSEHATHHPDRKEKLSLAGRAPPKVQNA